MRLYLIALLASFVFSGCETDSKPLEKLQQEQLNTPTLKGEKKQAVKKENKEKTATPLDLSLPSDISDNQLTLLDEKQTLPNFFDQEKPKKQEKNLNINLKPLLKDMNEDVLIPDIDGATINIKIKTR